MHNSDWVVPICLPFGEALRARIVNKMGEVAGWGLTNSENKRGTNFLQAVKVGISEIKEKKTNLIKVLHCTSYRYCRSISVNRFMAVAYILVSSNYASAV